MPEAVPQPPPRRPLHPPPPLVGRLAIGFVFLAMAALVVVPLLVQARVDAMRARFTLWLPLRDEAEATG